jgi:Tetracyclin repressor-like, C-terminal domain
VRFGSSNGLLLSGVFTVALGPFAVLGDLLGNVSGEREEHVVQGGPSQSNIGDRDVRVREPLKDLPSRETDWKTAMRQRALSARQVLIRHRWAIGLLESRLKPGDTNLRHHDSVLGCLREANFSVEMAIHAYSVLDSYIYGFALQEQALPFDSPETIGEVAGVMLNRIPANEYPYLKETIVEHFNKTGWEYADEFEFGLDLILDGLEKLRKKRSPPSAT